MKKWVALVVALLMLPCTAMAQPGEVWQVVAEDGTHLTWVCYEPEAGDQYIAADNRVYEVIRVDGALAVARAAGKIDLPDVSWLDADAALEVSTLTGKRLISLYCTHSDESYEPTDGTYSDEQRGSIYKMAESLAASLRENGAETEVSDTLHHPHDAGAYRRSRQTAVQLIKAAPDAVFDIHRDGVPDKKEYLTEIAGKDVSKIRILVGRGNQNMEVNKKFALQLKAVADKLYPGLIKDIYMGRGVYNQDLLPRSLLLECGTYTLPREQVTPSVEMMGTVICRTLYGGVVGSAGRSDTSGTVRKSGGVTEGEPDPKPAAEDNGGVGTGILWAVGLFTIGLIVYAFISTGSAKGGMKKVGRNISEMTGGLIGKKPKDGE